MYSKSIGSSDFGHLTAHFKINHYSWSFLLIQLADWGYTGVYHTFRHMCRDKQKKRSKRGRRVWRKERRRRYISILETSRDPWVGKSHWIIRQHSTPHCYGHLLPHRIEGLYKFDGPSQDTATGSKTSSRYQAETFEGPWSTPINHGPWIWSYSPHPPTISVLAEDWKSPVLTIPQWMHTGWWDCGIALW